MQWLFMIILLIYAFLAIKEPEIIWDIEHRRFVEGGEPTDYSLKLIVFSGWAALVIAVIISLVSIFFPAVFK